MQPNNGGNTVPRITRAEHMGPKDTGDNIEAKRVANYGWDGTNWQRTGPDFQMGTNYDETTFTNADGNGNYQTITYKLAGNTVRTLNLTFDANNNVTSIAKT
jgi:hypothetical protein